MGQAPRLDRRGRIKEEYEVIPVPPNNTLERAIESILSNAKNLFLAGSKGWQIDKFSVASAEVYIIKAIARLQQEVEKATHLCPRCGAFWAFHSADEHGVPGQSWQLVSKMAGIDCCDNKSMDHVQEIKKNQEPWTLPALRS